MICSDADNDDGDVEEHCLEDNGAVGNAAVVKDTGEQVDGSSERVRLSKTENN